MFLFISFPTILVIYVSSELIDETACIISTLLFILGWFGALFACWMLSKMSKSMADTGEIDAIAWLLITTPPQFPATFFKKASQMTCANSIGRHYRPRLLELLMSLLNPLITSHHAPEHHSSDTHSPQSDDFLNRRRPRARMRFVDNMVTINEDLHLKDLETYIASLAQLSEFTDCKGTFWCLREDAMQHPKLEQPLIDKLVDFANPQRHSQVMRSAAIKVLNNYKLDMEGNPLGPTVLESVATDPRSETTSTLNDNDLNRQERGHLEPYRLEDLATYVDQHIHLKRLKRREIGGEERRDVGDEEIEENPLESPTTISGNVATDLRGETTLMLDDNWSNCQEQGRSELYRLVTVNRATCEDLATYLKPAYSPEEEIEGMRCEIGDI